MNQRIAVVEKILGANEQLAAENFKVCWLLKTREALVIDGKLDEAVWKRARGVGFRYEAFLPPFENKPDSLRQGITQRYTEAAFSSGGFRLGNFYEIFGRGLLFRSYEERSLGVDSNMDGVLLWGTRGTGKSSLVRAVLNRYSHRA